jgi:competence protein ComEC
MKKISTALIITSLSLLTSFFGLLVWWQQDQLQNTSVVFLNVGQGDAILIQQGRHQILIDSGRESAQLMSELGRYVPFWDRHIEVIIPTHPDADHIGGFAGLTRQYTLGRILWTGVEGESDVYTQFQKMLSRGIPPERWHKVAAGSKLTLPQGGTLEILYPYETASGPAKDEDTNATSIVMRFQYGETSFLLTGDLAEEEKVLGKVQPVTVLKVAHHGSKYSSSDTFLGMVKPESAVISVGKNSYGHPSKDVLERIDKLGAKILRTDQEGSIEYRCVSVENKCEYVGRRPF